MPEPTESDVNDQPAKRRWPFRIIICGLMLCIGFFIPVLYDWGNSDYGRRIHKKLFTGMFLTVVVTTIWSLIQVWVTRRRAAQPSNTDRKITQWSIRDLVSATTIVAIIAAWRPEHWAVVGFLGAVIFWSLRQSPIVRARTFMTLAVVYFPFAWMIVYNKPFGHTSGLAENIPVAPSIFPVGMILGRMFRSNTYNLIGASIGAIAQLSIGILAAARYPRFWRIYIGLCLIGCTWASFIMHALYRM